MRQHTNGNYFEMWLREYRTRLQDVADHGRDITAANGNSAAAEAKFNVQRDRGSASPSAPADDLFRYLSPAPTPAANPAAIR